MNYTYVPNETLTKEEISIFNEKIPIQANQISYGESEFEYYGDTYIVDVKVKEQ